MKSGIVKRSVSIAGHRTSISLEEPFWDGLRMIASTRGMSLQALVGEIDSLRGKQNLSSAIRVVVLRAALEGALGHRDSEAAEAAARPALLPRSEAEPPPRT
jgi:predicted DNA-binding ribbon-helix-helix protein